MAKAETHKEIKPPLIKDIYDFSDQSLAQLKTWIEQAGLKIPASQLVGNATVPSSSPSVQDVIDALVALGLVSQV
jgi:hypothetical protein